MSPNTLTSSSGFIAGFFVEVTADVVRIFYEMVWRVFFFHGWVVSFFRYFVIRRWNLVFVVVGCAVLSRKLVLGGDVVVGLSIFWR